MNEHLETSCGESPCQPEIMRDCDFVFSELIVIPSREGGTKVQWTLDSRMLDQGEYRFTLQVGHAGVNDSKAYRDVVSETNVWFLTDPVRRLPGSLCFTHYRVKLETGERIYYSRPVSALGQLSYKDRQMFLAVMRAEWVQLQAETGIPGMIFKRKISGRECSRCLDYETRQSKDSQCPVCLGTGWIGGYYRPAPCCPMNIEPADASIHYDVNQRGPVTNTRFSARTLASPLLITGDIWLNLQNSERYRLMQIHPLVESKGIPVVYQVGMDRLPFSDIVYEFLNPNFVSRF
jgi:hypothetical protein